ncbi:MAG: ABC transporter permease [Akkermansiaceae bacterium]|nr:ABC transporter permease [Armatimonadota bacterium]
MSLSAKPRETPTLSTWANLVRHRELIENLVVRDVKTRYKQSALGYAWAVLNPLIVALTYYLVFGLWLKQGNNIAIPYTIYTYFGLLVWNLFAIGLSTATESLVMHLNLITKVYFPREVFPISAVLSKLVDVGFGLVGLLPLLFFFRIAPSPNIVLAICLLPIPILFTIGLGMLCACANLFFRDVRYLVTMALGLLAFAVPNMYPLSIIPAEHQRVYLSNPIAVTIEAMRRLTFPQTGSVSELVPYLGVACVVSIAMFFLGYAVFKHNEPRFAEFV